MRSWEYNLIPQERPGSDLALAVHTAGLFAMLVMLWIGAEIDGYDRHFYDVMGQMVGYYAPAALAMLLAMRCGVLDVSVWMSWSAGSVVAAGILHAALPGEGEVHAGSWPWLAFSAAAGVGAAVGGLNALLARSRKLPACLATVLTALLVWGLLHGLSPGREIPIHPRAFDAWHIETEVTPDDNAMVTNPVTAYAPLAVTRMFAVALIMSVVMLTILVHRGRAQARNAARPSPQVRAVALVTGGVISALGGALWLLENNAAAVPRLPVHDLRIPVAAVLAGGLVLAGQGRTLLAALYLPVGMLVSTMWYLDGWDFNSRGYALQMLPLLAAAVAGSLVLRVIARRFSRGAFPARRSLV